MDNKEYVKREVSCEDCLHNDVCYLQEVCNDIDKYLKDHGCTDFKSVDDVTEVRHGTKLGNPLSETEFICSVCYEDIDEDSVFCKHCGAKVD